MLPNQITIWNWTNEQFLSQYGRVTYSEWCDREIERVRRSGKRWEKLSGDHEYAGMVCLVLESQRATLPRPLATSDSNDSCQPGELRMKVFLQQEADRLGVTIHRIHQKISRGGYPGIKVRREDHMHVYVTPPPRMEESILVSSV